MVKVISRTWIEYLNALQRLFVWIRYSIHVYIQDFTPNDAPLLRIYPQMNIAILAHGLHELFLKTQYLHCYSNKKASKPCGPSNESTAGTATTKSMRTKASITCSTNLLLSIHRRRN